MKTYIQKIVQEDNSSIEIDVEFTRNWVIIMEAINRSLIDKFIDKLNVTPEDEKEDEKEDKKEDKKENKKDDKKEDQKKSKKEDKKGAKTKDKKEDLNKDKKEGKKEDKTKDKKEDKKKDKKDDKKEKDKSVFLSIMFIILHRYHEPSILSPKRESHVLALDIEVVSKCLRLLSYMKDCELFIPSEIYQILIKISINIDTGI